MKIQRTIKPISMKHIISTFFCTFLLAALPLQASAEDMVTDILPPTTMDKSADAHTDNTHPAIKLTLDKSELVRLDQEVGSIIIGSPSHINVIADSATVLVIVPRAPGATHFTVLGKKGQVLMQRHVIVAAPKEDYVRVKRTCTNAGDSCAETSVFYCPDTCHEIGIDTSDIQN